MATSPAWNSPQTVSLDMMLKKLMIPMTAQVDDGEGEEEDAVVPSLLLKFLLLSVVMVVA